MQDFVKLMIKLLGISLLNTLKELFTECELNYRNCYQMWWEFIIKSNTRDSKAIIFTLPVEMN
jgi:hypothetical protein